MPDPASLHAVRAILQDARTVAVVGAHPSTSRPAYYVPAYLHEVGMRIVPVNERFAGKGPLFGEEFRSSLASIGEPVDVVDVFRRGEAVGEHLDDLLAMRPPPKVVWLQSGIENEAVARELRAHGIQVVQDRCMLADHQRLGLGRAPDRSRSQE